LTRTNVDTLTCRPSRFKDNSPSFARKCDDSQPGRLIWSKCIQRARIGNINRRLGAGGSVSSRRGLFKMWTALTLVGVLAAANGYSDQVTISNVRLTRGLLGPEREDSKIIVGDSFFIAFDIEGLKADDTGRVRYNLAMEATDSRGNVVYTQKPRDLEAINALGGSRVPAFSFLDVGPSVAPGEYTMKVTATDRTTKA